MLKRILLKFSYVIVLFVSMLLIFNVKNKEQIETNILEEFVNVSNLDKSEEVKEVSSVIKIPDKRQKLLEMKQANSDTEAWIYIPGTNIDWPIVKWVFDEDGKTCFYHRRNEYKKKAFEGCIYGGVGDVFSPFSELSNLILYGHNLDDNPEGKKFAQLVKFQDIEFARNTPYIFITTLDKQLVYQIYAVGFIDIGFECHQPYLESQKQKEMIEGMKERSQYIYDVDVSEEDKLITLYTCTYRYGAYQSVAQVNTRFIIQGKLLKEEENLLETVSLVRNPNPKEPNISKK